ncbi:MAG: hypothetical protein ACXVRW_10035 [Solirubrobacteraceae bacterium]
MVTHHHLSKLLIDERVTELRNASAGHRRVERAETRPRRRRLAFRRRRAIRPISSSPS